MESKRIIGVIIVVMMIFGLFSCSNSTNENDIVLQENEVAVTNNEVNASEDNYSTLESEISELQPQYTGQIYLYGEEHGVDKIIDKEFELWYDYYHNQSMRHLFIETPYYSAEFLNVWMQFDDDEILDKLVLDLTGTSGANPIYRAFYEKIKLECPETIFHGTDVGHQYESTGKRYLEFLKENKLEDSEQYEIAKEVIEQGELYSTNRSAVYRENMMVENFKRELETLSYENIMGIYGAAHTGLDSLDNSKSIPCMANQLDKIYKSQIYSESLIYLAKAIEPERIDRIAVNGKDYEALYFGKHNMDFTNEFQFREFWRLENAYDDFKDNILTMDGLPETNYPLLIEEKQVFIIDYTKHDGSVERKYLRVDGFIWDGMLTSEGFILQKIEKQMKEEYIDTISISGKDYKASYFGKHDIGGQLGTDTLDYWRIEEAYTDFKDMPLDGSALPYNMYPINIETGQVFVLDVTMMDGSVNRGFFRSDGNEWRSKLSTEGFTIEN